MAGCGVSGAARGAAVVSGGTAVQGGCTVLYITVTAHPWVGELVWKGGLAKRDGGTVLYVCMYVHIYVCVSVLLIWPTWSKSRPGIGQLPIGLRDLSGQIEA